MWKIIKELRSLKSLPKNKADQLVWLKELASEIEDSEADSHGDCYSLESVNDLVDEAVSRTRREAQRDVEDLEERIEQLEKILKSQNKAFPKKLRSSSELRKFKLIPGGI